MTPSEGYRHRADNAHRYADECKLKMGYKPDSAEAYKSLSDRSRAEGFVWDSAARNFDDDPKKMVAGMRREQPRLEREGRSSFDHDRFVEESEP